MGKDGQNPGTETVEFLWETNKYLCQQLVFADAKAAAIVGLSSLVVSLYTSSWAGHVQKPWLVSGLLLASASAVLSFLVVFPRLHSRRPCGVIFWEHIARNSDASAYRQRVKESDFPEELAEQNWALASILQRKYLWLRVSFVFLVLLLLTVGVSLVVAQDL